MGMLGGLTYSDETPAQVGLVWIDAHGDYNTPETTLSGMLGGMPVAVAVDWVGNNIYVVDEFGQQVDVFDIDGLFNSIVMSSNLTAPSDIALDPTVGHMFIADSNRIVRARMDGTHVKVLVTENVYKASGIALDLVNKRVYFSDTRCS